MSTFQKSWSSSQKRPTQVCFDFNKSSEILNLVCSFLGSTLAVNISFWPISNQFWNFEIILVVDQTRSFLYCICSTNVLFFYPFCRPFYLANYHFLTFLLVYFPNLWIEFFVPMQCNMKFSNIFVLSTLLDLSINMPSNIKRCPISNLNIRTSWTRELIALFGRYVMILFSKRFRFEIKSMIKTLVKWLKEPKLVCFVCLSASKSTKSTDWVPWTR